jgi:hypothetical protein
MAVGIQICYLDPLGRKSTVEPKRRTFMLDVLSAKNGAFRIGVPAAAERPFIFTGVVATEGVEDALSCAEAAIAERIVGCLGVVKFKKCSNEGRR